MFKKLLLLDFNIIGVITSFINTDFHFLFFLQEKSIKPFYKEITYDNIDWNELSYDIEKYENFYNDNSIDIIEEFKENYNWDTLTTIKLTDQNFLTKYSENINFEIISDKMNFDETLDYSFFTDFIEKINWTKLSRWGNMAEDFIDIFYNQLDWSILCRTQGLTQYLLDKYFDKLILNEIRYNHYIDQEIRNSIVERLENIEIEEAGENNTEEIGNISLIVHSDSDTDDIEEAGQDNLENVD